MPKLPPKSANNKVGSYGLVGKFAGYHARADQTMESPNVLVSPSQNFVMNTAGRMATVKGYTLDGASANGVIDSGILSNFDFINFKGDVRNLRAGFLNSTPNTGRLQYRYLDASNAVHWVDLLTGLNNVRLAFCEFWDNTNLVKDVLWVDGTNNIFAWNGAVTTFAAASNASGYISVLNSTPTAAGTGYVIGDILTITGGTATAMVTGVTGADSGAMTAISIVVPGNSYVVGDVLTVPTGTGGTLTVTSVNGGQITGLSITTGGVSYTATYYLPTGGTGHGAEILVNSIAGQAITSVSLVSTGSGYTGGAGNATTGGTGTGATLNITTVVANSITKQGSKTWAQEGFLQANGNVTVGGVQLSYTAAVGNLLVGIGNDPTTPAFAVGTISHQSPVITPLTAVSGVLSTFGPTVIGCGRRNQVHLGASNSNILYISKVNTYTDFTFSTPTRVVGEGALIPLDAPPTTFIPLENRNDSSSYDMYISEGLSNWAVIRATLSSDLTKETLEHIRVKVAALQGAISGRLASKMKNHIIFVGNDNVANFLGYLSYQFVPETVDFSYPIIDDTNSYDFTDGQIYYSKNQIYISVPKSGLIRIYNMTDQTKQSTSSIRGVEDVDVADQPWFWESPVTYPISGFYWTPDKGLCGHSYTTSESYQLFTGGSLNGQEIDCNATFAFDDKGDRTQSKASDELWVEGYIKQNTVATASIIGDLNSFQTNQSVTINGNDNVIVAYGSGAHALGKNNLGSQPLGGAQVGSTLPAWFHVAKTYPEAACYLEQISFSVKGVDQQLELITFGTNSKMTNEGNNAITQ